MTETQQRPAPGLLFDEHTRELLGQSAIDPAVIVERGYRTVSRPTANDDRPRQELKRLGIPTWAIDENRYFPGLLIPMYRATGECIAHQWKPGVPVAGRNGKKMKYASVKGHTNRIDVHPRNRDRIIDPTVPLWITEGIKKADSLTSRGCCVAAITGVYNWRSQLGTLGDWEDIPLRGRKVIVCFDADARTNPNVLRAMQRLGRWLKSKGVKETVYLIVPEQIDGKPCKGADDYFAVGGTVEQLVTAGTNTPPKPDAPIGAELTDSLVAEAIVADVLDSQYLWCKGLGWLGWDGRRWTECSDETVGEPIRQWAIARFTQIAASGNTDVIDAWRSILSLGKQRAALNLARGIVECKPDDLDAHPDLLNTPSGVVDVRSGTMTPHDPNLRLTKITSGSYRPGYTHPDWEQALQALPTDVQGWMQVRIGQGATGHTTPDGIMPLLQGGGENGKSLLTTDGAVPALGDYASMASAKLFAAGKGTEHSTERADLRGRRLLIAEELTEGRSIDVTALKQIQDVGRIKAHYMRRDNIEFETSHSLFTTTNYVPVVSETDHGTWRRLALVRFPYTFRPAAAEIQGPDDRLGDPDLKARIRANRGGQHDAIVTWAVAGAIRWYTEGAAALRPPASVAADTLAWRAEADRILGFWTERIIADPDRCVISTELLDAFNDWLKANGHNVWAKETFTPRFEQHSETTKHRVERRVTVKLGGLSRYYGHLFGEPPEPPPRQARVWIGVRFRTDSDLRGDDQVDEVDNPLGLPAERLRTDAYPGGLSTSSTSPGAAILASHNGRSTTAGPKPASTCQRWLGNEHRFCNATDDLRRYPAGWLCPDHQPERTAA